MALEHRRESRVDRLGESQRLLCREVHAARLLCHDSGRARRERRDHLLGRGHLRERGDLERQLTHLVARREVVVREFLAGRAPCGHEPAGGSEDRVALVVRADGVRRAVRHLRVRPRVAQVAHRAEMEDGRTSLRSHPFGELARDPEHLCRVVAVRDLVPDLGPRGERRLDPARGRGDTDAEAVVLAYEEQGKRKALERDLRRRVERRLRGRVVDGGVAEGTEDDCIGLPRARHADPTRTVDRQRHAHRPRDVRGDRRGHREDRQLPPAEDLVSTPRDRLDRGGDDAEHDVAEPAQLGLGGSREIERTRAVVEKRRIVDAQRQRDRCIRLVSCRADRVEAPAVLLQPAGGVVGLPAVDLRAPDLLHPGRSRTQCRARL